MKRISIALGVILSVFLIQASVASATVTFQSPSSGMLPRVFKAVGDGPGQILCYCEGFESDMTPLGNGKYLYTATVWAYPTGATLGLHAEQITRDSPDDQADLNYQVTGNAINPFGMIKADLDLHRSGKKGYSVVDVSYVMRTGYSLLAEVVLQKRAAGKWKTVAKDRDTKPFNGASDLSGTEYPQGVRPNAKVPFKELKRGRHRVILTFRVSGQPKIRKVYPISAKKFQKGQLIQFAPTIKPFE